MAKTFNPNRVGGGTVSIVRAADGTYSLKETGFDRISSLNMIDLGAVATTTTAAKTETAAEKTGTTTADQTKQAFLLPKQDNDNDQFTTEKMLKSATDVSKSLSEVETVSDRQKTESQLGADRNPFKNIDTGVREFEGIKDPTESVFGSSMPSKEQFERQGMLPSVETPQEKLKMTSYNVQKGLVEPEGFTNPFKGFLGSKFKTEKGSEVTQAGKPGMLGDTGGSMNRMGSTMPGMLDPTGRMGASNTLGISADPSVLSTQAQQEAAALGIKSTISGTDLEADVGTVARSDIQPVVKKTFRESVSTALKGVGEAAQMMSPIMGVVQALGTPRNESASTTAFNKGKFNIVTSSGPMQGRIVGNDGNYDPANNLFHGMNRSSALGNLEKAGQKRIDNINKTLARQAKSGKQSQTLIDRRDKFERELNDYRSDKNDHNIKSAQKKGIDTSKLNPNEMRNVAETGNESGNTGGKSIVCTAMYQTTGLQDWAKAMKIWYIYQKKYLTIQHQEGYHKLFKPFVKGMHKNNIIKAIGAHFAKHRTQHLKNVLFKSKPSLLGKVYSKVLETICYWAGKK